MAIEWLIDGTLASGLLLLAWLTLSSADLFKGIVLFISFGLLVTIIWSRLGAMDIAIAEAAIGAGLTGALLLAAWQRLQQSAGDGSAASDAGEPKATAADNGDNHAS